MLSVKAGAETHHFQSAPGGLPVLPVRGPQWEKRDTRGGVSPPLWLSWEDCHPFLCLWGLAVTWFFDLRYLLGLVMARQPPPDPASTSRLEQAWSVLALAGCGFKVLLPLTGSLYFNKMSCLIEKMPWQGDLAGGQAGSQVVKVSTCPGWADQRLGGPGQQVQGQ